MPSTSPPRKTTPRSTLAQREAKQRKKISQIQAAAGGVKGGEFTGTTPMILPNDPPLLSFYVHGLPASQGSKTIEGSTTNAAGKKIARLVEQNAPDPWRDEVRAVMTYILRRRPGWTAITHPVFVHANFYMPTTPASESRGDIWFDNAPDLDKVERAFGDAISVPPVPLAIGKNMPENAKRRVRQEYRDNQARLNFLADDSLIVGWIATHMYCGSPGALSNPGVACTLYKAPDPAELLESLDATRSSTETTRGA